MLMWKIESLTWFETCRDKADVEGWSAALLAVLHVFTPKPGMRPLSYSDTLGPDMHLKASPDHGSQREMRGAAQHVY